MWGAQRIQEEWRILSIPLEHYFTVSIKSRWRIRWSHLWLFGVTLQYNALYNSGIAIPFLNGHRLLCRPLQCNLLFLCAIRGYVAPNDLPSNLKEISFMYLVFEWQNQVLTQGVCNQSCEALSDNTFFTTVCPCSSMYSSSVTVSGGMSGISSPWTVERKGSLQCLAPILRNYSQVLIMWAMLEN